MGGDFYKLIGYVNSKVKGLGKTLNWAGVTTTELTDGSTTNPITINGQSYTAKSGDVVQYGNTQFAMDKDEVWQTYNLEVKVEGKSLIFG